MGCAAGGWWGWLQALWIVGEAVGGDGERTFSTKSQYLNWAGGGGGGEGREGGGGAERDRDRDRRTESERGGYSGEKHNGERERERRMEWG